MNGKLSVGNTKSGWRECRLGDVLQLQRGFDLPAQKRIEGTIPIFSSSGISGFHSHTVVNGPGVITGRYGTIGQVFYTDTSYWPLNTTLFVKDFKKNFPKYIYYLLKNFDFEAFNDKSAVPGVNRNHLHEAPIVLPPLPEQRAIASVLSSLDDKINLLHRQNKTLEAMAETLFRQWFVEEVAGGGEQGKISDLIDFNPTRLLHKGTIAPYLEMSNVSTAVFHPENWYDREFSSGMKFINGDTLIARITPCLENGKSAFITFLKDGQVGWGSTEYIVMRSKEILHPLFTYALAKNKDFRDYAEGCLEGSSGRQRVNIDHLVDFEITIPPKRIIDTFNSTMAGFEPKLHNNFLEIRTLENLRDTLLPKLMSSEVRVKL